MTKAKSFQTIGLLMESPEWQLLTDAEQRLVELMVRRYGDEMFPSQTTLKKLQKVCRRTIISRLQHIVEVGIFTVDPAVYGRRGKPGRTTNTYRVNEELLTRLHSSLHSSLHTELVTPEKNSNEKRTSLREEETEKEERVVLKLVTSTDTTPSLTDALELELEVQNLGDAEASPEVAHLLRLIAEARLELDNPRIYDKQPTHQALRDMHAELARLRDEGSAVYAGGET